MNHFALIANNLWKNLLSKLLLQKTFGKSVISTYIHMEMLEEFKMDLAGALLANTELVNVLVILSKHVQLKNMISTLKLFHSLFV